MGYEMGMLLARGLRSLRLSTVVLIVAAICVALLLLFPPFYVHLPDGMLSNKGHAFVLNPPNHGVLVARVDTPVLAADIFGVVVIAALAFFIAWRNERGQRSVGPSDPRNLLK
jgi:small-conductance mechanosensitive channel